MPLESQNSKNEDTIISLTSAYIKAVYTAKGDINHQTAIKIKNQIVVLLGTLYKDVLEGYLKDSLDKTKVTSFIQIVSRLIASGIIKAKEDMYGFLIEKNINLSYSNEQIEIVKKYINTEIDKNISSARDEMDSVIDLFRQRCLEIVLEGQKHSSTLLYTSHQRSLQRISKLQEEISGLGLQISSLYNENSGLKSEVTTLQTDISKKQKIITDGYKSWKNLNTRVGEYEKEKESILSLLSSIETELTRKRRSLKGETLIEKIESVLIFTREIQNQESYWQQSFARFETSQRTETTLREEIGVLQHQLSLAKDLLQEVNNELAEEQRRVQTLTSTEETAIKEILKTQITNYFYFLFHTEDIINQTKQEELEIAIKMTYYRAKVLNLDLFETLGNLISRLRMSYENSYPSEQIRITNTYNNLKDFMNLLQYGSKSFDHEIKSYTNIYEMKN